MHVKWNEYDMDTSTATNEAAFMYNHYNYRNCARYLIHKKSSEYITLQKCYNAQHTLIARKNPRPFSYFM